MRNNFTWIFFLLLSCASVWPHPVQPATTASDPRGPQPGEPPEQSQEQVISVRITSSVAVSRGKGKPSKLHETRHDHPHSSYQPTSVTESLSTAATERHGNIEMSSMMPPDLAGANLEFIKQLHYKTEARGLQHFESIHSYATNNENQYSNDTVDSVAEPTSVLEVDVKNDDAGENVENIPLARSVSVLASSKNYIQGIKRKPLSERGNNQRLTTVSFNIVHDQPKVTTNYEPSDTYVTSGRSPPEKAKYYNEPPNFYHEPAKVYSQPAQVYSEPAKFYSEPAKIYSEPAKIYSEPAKVYSEPAKIYSEPAKFYSQPASLHLPHGTNNNAWQRPVQAVSSTVVTSTPYTTVAVPPVGQNRAHNPEHQPEKNYEVDEKISVMTDGRSHGVQGHSSTESCKQENCKSTYVVEGQGIRKYRVEERTADGFIVGEYGVVGKEEGTLRGVRYTADSDASPRLIYDALMKFLQLK